MTRAISRHVFAHQSLLAAAVAEAFALRVREPGEHHVVVTGGGVGTDVLAHVKALGESIDWQRIHLWWGDERFLPEGHPERNETGAREVLIDHVPIPADQVHPMPADVGQGADEAATAYADELARASRNGFAPDFEIVLLGIGPEGHVASLFPHSPALESASTVVGVHGTPKPPPTRVSMTLPAIRSARDVWVIAAGCAKAPAVEAAMDPDMSVQELPAAGARGREHTVFWLDREAAGQD